MVSRGWDDEGLEIEHFGMCRVCHHEYHKKFPIKPTFIQKLRIILHLFV